MAGIWAEVLHLDAFGTDDNFFEFGGHSLLVMRAVWRIRQTLGVEVPLEDFFADATVAGLGRLVDARQQAAAPQSLVPAPVAEAAAPAPLSFAQQRMWILDQLDPTGAAYVTPSVQHIRGPLDVPLLEGALRSLVNRHEALRTTFQLIDGELQQVVADDTSWALPVVEPPHPGPDGAAFEELLRADASRRFDLSRGPLFRACLYRMARDSHVLLLVMHHIVSDGWSMGLLFEELGVLYTGGPSASLTPLAVQYRDATRWQRGWLQGEVLDSQLSYWRKRLAGAPQLLESAYRPNPTGRGESPRGAVLAHGTARSRGPAAATVPARGDDPVHDLGLRVLGVARPLQRPGRFADRHTRGQPPAGGIRRGGGLLREHFGPPCRPVRQSDCQGTPGADQDGVLGGVRQSGSAIRAGGRGSARHSRSQPQRRVSAMFGLQNAPARPLDLGGLDVEPIALDLHAAQFDLSVLAWETPDGLRADFSYATELFDRATIARLAEHWRALLEGAVSAPDRRIGEVQMLTPAEHQQVVVEWNATGRDYDGDSRLHKLVEAQVARTPDAIAVVFEGREVSYRELDGRANQLAHELRNRGVGPDVRVGVFAERSVELVSRRWES